MNEPMIRLDGNIRRFAAPAATAEAQPAQAPQPAASVPLRLRPTG